VPALDEELITLGLFELGAQGVSQDLSFIQESQQYDPEIIETSDVDLLAFFAPEKKEELENSQLLKDFSYDLTVEKNKDWLAEWKKHFKPFEVFDNLWIVPSWEKKDFLLKDNMKAIYIEPGLAFGTGTHATTKLCLSSIFKTLSSSSHLINSALDLGSGSSVLSIYLKQMGVDKVTACEIDPLARENGKFNLELNSIKNVEVLGPGDSSLDEDYDLVVANIIDGVLLKLKEEIFSKKPKFIILSGILTENKSKLIEAFTSGSYSMIDSGELDEWSFLLLKSEAL